MQICFKTRKTEKIFNSARKLQKEYGADRAKKIRLRMAVLRSAVSLAEVPEQKPDRRHGLKGDRKGQYAVDLVHPSRLIFKPKDPVPISEGGEIDLSKVTEIVILGVEDYHGD
jgi:proteic killer suppression protein